MSIRKALELDALNCSDVKTAWLYVLLPEETCTFASRIRWIPLKVEPVFKFQVPSTVLEIQMNCASSSDVWNFQPNSKLSCQKISLRRMTQWLQF
ncbi:predicted protein [Botrytis cinerea T4]|uniref:Uncharacterized protein n=1 Tax=Botryotinia fuckeliana (strain T4) TaxID=999810 RepID=G2YL26_BOTF4|nr:predicted protein [Botrytis cinerea T4]